jgi:hypothetical protein
MIAPNPLKGAIILRMVLNPLQGAGGERRLMNRVSYIGIK